MLKKEKKKKQCKMKCSQLLEKARAQLCVK